MAETDLKVKLRDDVVLKNPVMVCSGTFGYGREFSDFMDLSMLGGIFTKAITPAPRAGNPPPRTIETPAGMLNAIGLENVGLDAFVEHKLPFLAELDTAVFVNVAGSSEEDYLEVVDRLTSKDAVDGFEINISCPNVKKGGIAFGTDPQLAGELIAALRKATDKLIITKLSPNVTEITDIAGAVCDAGADVLSLVNTFRGMAIDARTQRPVLGNVIGGLSGPAIKPLALYNVYRVSLNTAAPVIGMGGIMDGNDAVEFMLAGANAVSIGTANFVHPDAALRVLGGITDYCEAAGINAIGEIVGRAQVE